VEVKAEENCLAHAKIIAIARVDNHANCKAYRQGRPVDQALLIDTGTDLTRGGWISELNRFQKHFRDYKIVVSQGLGCDDIMYEGQVDSSKPFNLFYDDVERYYHVILNLKGAMVKIYVYNPCHKGCVRDITNVCDQTCSDCMASSPCVFSDVRIP